MATLSPVCFAMVSARRLSHLLSTLRICKRVVQDIPKKLLLICRTVVTFLCGHCPNCRTVVSLRRFLWAATLKPPNPDFGVWLWSLMFPYTFSFATCHFRAPGGPGAFWSSWALLGAPGDSWSLLGAPGHSWVLRPLSHFEKYHAVFLLSKCGVKKKSYEIGRTIIVT